MNYCPNCGENVNDKNFCPNCGEKLNSNKRSIEETIVEEKIIVLKGLMSVCTVTHESITIEPKIGKPTTIRLSEINMIKSRAATMMATGELKVETKTGITKGINFQYKENPKFEEIIFYLQSLNLNVSFTTIDVGGNVIPTTNNSSMSAQTIVVNVDTGNKTTKSAFGGLRCPVCKGHNIDLMRDDINLKTKQETSLNLNPLKPFTITNTKVKQKKKKSAAKVGLAVITMGTSVLTTGGLSKTPKNEFYCRDCGKTFTKKK